MPHSISIEETAAGLNQFMTRYSPQVHQKMKQGLEFETLIPVVNADYAYTGQDIVTSNVVQPYQSAFTPNNTEVYDGIDNRLRPLKVDVSFTAEQLEKFFSRWQAGWFTPDPEQTRPLYAAFIINNFIIPQALEDLNRASWAGEYAAPTPGTAGNYLASVDGFKKGIATQITAGRIEPITVGSVFGSDMVEYVREFCGLIPEPYRYKQGKIFMSKTNAQAYADKYQVKYPTRIVTEASPDQLYLRVDHFNKTIVGVTAMEGSNRIVCVFDNAPSMIYGTRTGYPQYFQFRFQPFDRVLKCMAEIYRFYGFETCQHLYVSDQV